MALELRRATENAAPIAAALPPIIINSNYDHWQRGTSALTHTTTYNSLTSYSADRFFTLPVGASVTSQQSTTVPDNKSLYSVQINGAASVTTVDHGQRIRAAYTGRYRQPLVFSAWVLNESGAAFTPNLRVGTPGAADNFTTVTNRLDQALQSCADSAWTRVGFVFDPTGYTNIANGLEVAIRVPSGSLVASDIVRIAQFDLRPGTQMVAYAPPDVEEEWARCLRYREIIGGTSASESLAAGVMATTSRCDAPVFFARKRGTPSLSLSAAADWDVGSASALTTGSSVAFNGIGLQTANIALTTTASHTAGDSARILANTTSARLIIDAEL